MNNEAAKEFAEKIILQALGNLESEIPFIAEVCKNKETEIHHKGFSDRIECWLGLFQQLNGACQMLKILKMVEKGNEQG